MEETEGERKEAPVGVVDIGVEISARMGEKTSGPAMGFAAGDVKVQDWEHHTVEEHHTGKMTGSVHCYRTPGVPAGTEH